MITIHPVESDTDREAWRIRLVVQPNERAASVAEMHRTAHQDQMLLLAELNGDLAGSGLAGVRRTARLP